MKNIFIAFLLLFTLSISLNGHSTTTQKGKYESNVEFHRLVSAPVTASLFSSYLEQSEEEEDLPFDNAFMNWIAKLFLWFIYLSLALMIVAFTLTSIISRNFWSWLPCWFFAFFYAMWLGRYWGYTACLIVFIILFSSIKILLLYTKPGKQWNAKYLEDGNTQLLKKIRKKKSSSDK